MVMYMLGAQPIEAPWEFAITPELFPFEILGPGEHPFPLDLCQPNHNLDGGDR